MSYRTTRYLPLCALVVLAGCQTTRDPLAELRAHKPTPTEILQQATSLAIGNLAWESVKISAVEHVDGRVRWLGTTRSEKYRCTADADGQNSFCER